jgi:hypothetical protein
MAGGIEMRVAQCGPPRCHPTPAAAANQPRATQRSEEEAPNVGSSSECNADMDSENQARVCPSVQGRHRYRLIGCSLCMRVGCRSSPTVCYPARPQ